LILDLNEHKSDEIADCDICIIGAGIAGLLLATELRKQGLKIVVVESGGRTQDTEDNVLNKTIMINQNYAGATRGRVRCLGGTSTRWGGALIPFQPSDLLPRPHIGQAGWPISMEELQQFAGSVESLFKVEPGTYDAQSLMGEQAMQPPLHSPDPDFALRFAKWPTFRRRNVANLLKRDLLADGVWIWLNATVTSFTCDTVAGRLEAVTAKNLNGRRLTVRARHFVMCAGAIESTRMLLLLDRQYGNRIFQYCDALGNNFHDHVSWAAARLDVKRFDAINRLASFRFSRGTMRSLRFELTPNAQASDAAASAFGHISYASRGDTGLDALRDFLRSLQRSGRCYPSQAVNVLKDLPYLSRAAYWRVFYQQLLWPPHGSVELNVVVEQLPSALSRITLADEIDVLGSPLAAIDWRVRSAEYKTLKSFIQRFDAYWRRHNLDAIAGIVWNDGVLREEENAEAIAGDIYHPGGSTCMGVNGRTAVVDRDLKAFAIENLHVASTSVFPSGASANPTFTLMLLVMRLAGHLGRQFNGTAPVL
jgi:choline dehydrogenase-like flavoprotein